MRHSNAIVNVLSERVANLTDRRLFTRWLTRPRSWWLLATVVVITGGTLGVRSQSVTPPILVVTSVASTNPYGGYLAEILRAEGLNSFAVADASTLSASQ